MVVGHIPHLADVEAVELDVHAAHERDGRVERRAHRVIRGAAGTDRQEEDARGNDADDEPEPARRAAQDRATGHPPIGALGL